MVPIEETINYLSRINNSPKLTTFNNLLGGREIHTSEDQDSNELNQVYYGVIKAIRENNKQDFVTFYSIKSKSKPSKDSAVPFINDDFLIFILLVGVVKFGIDGAWISDIISIRNKNTITITFENIIKENYYSKSILPEIVYMYLHFTKPMLITNDFINFTYKSINDNTQLFEGRSDFQILCAINSYNLIVISKEVPDKSQLLMLQDFTGRFLKRVKFLSWLIQAALFWGVIYLLLTLPKYSPETIKFIEKYNYAFTIFGALGLSFLGNVVPIFKKMSQIILLRLLGASKTSVKELIKEKGS